MKSVPDLSLPTSLREFCKLPGSLCCRWRPMSATIQKQLSIVRSSVSLAFHLDNSDGRSPDRIKELATDDYPTPSPSDAARTARFCHV